MDWIKCKVTHLLDINYTNAEIGALYRLQAITAMHGRMPTEIEIKSILTLKKYEILSEKVLNLSGKSLELILKKVLEDHEKSSKKTEKNREYKANSRLKEKHVMHDMSDSGSEKSSTQIRIDKNRVDKKKEKEKKETDNVGVATDPPPNTEDLPKSTPEDAMLIWNDFASKHGLPEVREMNDKRISGVKARIKQKGFRIEEIFDEIKKSDCLKGKNNRGWKVNFDFVFCSENNWLKIVEGNYRGGGNSDEWLKEVWNDI